MRINYDYDAGALTIEVNQGVLNKTDEIDSVLLDEDEQGQLLNIEIINPFRHWPVETVLERYSLNTEAEQLLRELCPLYKR